MQNIDSQRNLKNVRFSWSLNQLRTFYHLSDVFKLSDKLQCYLNLDVFQRHTENRTNTYFNFKKYAFAQKAKKNYFTI